jgi:predicted RNA binding protein YcfA (HicA-like mRNA interferase family)
MPLLAPAKRRALLAVLRRNGLVEDPGQGKGSHVWLAHPDDPSKCTTIPSYPEIGPDLLLRILKQAGKTREEYEARPREA